MLHMIHALHLCQVSVHGETVLGAVSGVLKNIKLCFLVLLLIIINVNAVVVMIILSVGNLVQSLSVREKNILFKIS